MNATPASLHREDENEEEEEEEDHRHWALLFSPKSATDLLSQQSLTEMAEEAIRSETHDKEEEEEEGDDEKEEEKGERHEDKCVDGPLMGDIGGATEDDAAELARVGEREDDDDPEKQETAAARCDDEQAGDEEEADHEEGEAEEEEEASAPRTRRFTLTLEELARAKQMEESRVVLELEADELAEQEVRGGDGLKQTEADESAAEPTAFGLPRVELQDPDNPRRRSSLTTSIQLVAALAVDKLSRRPSRLVKPSHPQDHAVVLAKQRIWRAVGETVWSLLVLVDALYVLVSVPFRIGFLYDPWDTAYHRNGGSWTQSLLLLSILDVLGELCRWRYTWKVLKKEIQSRRTRAPKWVSRRVSSVNPLLIAKSLAARPIRGSLFSVQSERATATKELQSFDVTKSFESMSGVGGDLTGGMAAICPPVAVVLLGIVPFEIVAATVNANFLHLARVGKLLIAAYSLIASYSTLLLKCRSFSFAQWLSFSTLATPFYLFWLGLYLCHVAACGYMLIATIECGLESQFCARFPLPGSWVLKDSMEQALLWRRYVRTMYWASKTITTLGQGDLVPATEIETNYCIIVQFISGLWATAFLASCSFYFSRRDRDIDNGVSTRLEQALRFLRSRKVPSTLSIQIRNYYQHAQRTRNGIEEEQVLANLPGHYQFQCAFFMKYRLIAKVPFFTKQPKAFVRTVVNALDSDFLSPKDTVLALFDIEELVIVARGDICVMNQQKELVHVLSPEEWFAEDALFDDHRSQFELEAKTFCEIFRLSRPVFIACMEKHFPKLRIAAVMAQQKRRSAVSPPRAVQSARPTIALIKPRSTRMSLLKRFSQRDGFENVPWQHPASHFRKYWRRWKVFFLLFLAAEVPYEIAFKWRLGVLDQRAATSQHVVYVASVAAETFFYVDWFLRARRFHRRAPRHEPHNDGSPTTVRDDTQKSLRSDMAATVIRKKDDMIKRPQDLFRLYLASDDVFFDMLAILPISMVWNFVNESRFSNVLREIMRCARLLALGRLVALKPTMKKIMVEFDFSPASHLLTNVIVFCMITANAMSCYFYLLADDKDFVDALPAGFDAKLTPVRSSDCLEQATLFGNCTWYINDRSTFGIDARYIRSLHWSLVLLSTVGYGDILSFTNSECLIGFWWIFLGALICYFTSCAVGSVVSQVTVLRTAQDARVEEITRALVRSNVSPAIRAMIRCYYDANWELNGSVLREECLMKRLPRSLRHQLSSSLYLHSLRKCYVFVGFGGQLNMIREIALAMTSSIVLPGFLIVESGHLGSQLFLVQSGEVEVLLPLRFRGGSVVASKKTGFLHQRRRRFFSRENLRRLSQRLFSKVAPEDSSLDAISMPSSLLVRSRGHDRHRIKDVPVAVLKEGDCFGDEGLLPHTRYALSVSVRALTSTQVGVLHRDAFLSLSERFPMQLGQMIALIMNKYEENQQLFATIRGNLENRDKVREFLGSCQSVYVERTALVNGIITPDRDFYRVWRIVHGLVMLYNFYQITFRLAFLPNPAKDLMIKLTVIDYLMDAFLYADIYLKWNRFGYEQYGENVTTLFLIRRRYKKGWFTVDCLSMLPLYFYGDYFCMTLARLPRLLKSAQLLEIINEIEALIREQFMKGSTTLLSVFDLIKFLAFFLSAAHHIGSVYFLVGRVLTTYKLAPFSWMTVDPVINAHPGNILVEYNRAIYWCLETFTVVCFGDVLSRNWLETLFASMTCVIGWMCIGQIVGRITSLMASIDMDMKDHNMRVDKFEQYASNRKLPQFLRERAVESVEYKSKCTIELNMRSIFADLPLALHVILFEELHGSIVRGVPELAETCTQSQIRVLANAFVLEIFVADDIIIEEGRLGTKLFVMKEGRAEHFSAQSRMVFAAIHEGVLFGDLAFFLSGTRQISSVRASRSCQVLQLDRANWLSLWSDEARLHLESKIVPMMRNKYRSVSRAFLNIVKNLELSLHAPPRLSVSPEEAIRAAAFPDIGASTRSLQSSVGGGRSTPLGSDNSNLIIPTKPADRIGPSGPHAGRTMSQVFGYMLGLTSAHSKVAPGSSPSLNRGFSTKRKKKSKKRSVPSGGQHRKLSGVLGIIIGRPPQDSFTQAESAELQWKRHERNLRVLQFIDTRLQQGREALQVRTTHSGNLDKLESDSEIVVDDASPLPLSVSPASCTAPSAEPSTKGKLEVTQEAESFHRGLGVSARPSSATRGKRHSIQVDRKDLNLAFRTPLDEPKQTPVHQHLRAVKVATGVAAGHIAQGLPTVRVASDNSQGTAFSRVVTSAVNALHNAKKTPPIETRATPNTNHSTTSSTASTGSDVNEGSSYVQHLDNLKMRSMRRQRRSVFTAIKDNSDEIDETKNPYEIWLEPPLPPSFCLENSRFRRVWNTIMYCICLYYILVVPFRVSFDFDYLSSHEFNTMTTIWFSIEYVMDALCVVDFFLHKSYFTFVHRGTLVTDKRAIRDHYLRHGSYIVDLISIVPLELLIPLTPFLSDAPDTKDKVTWYRIAVFRLNKMARIAHLHELGDKLQRMLVYDVKISALRPSLIYFIRFAFDFALGAHWVACLFFGAALNAFQQGVPSWLTTPGMLTFGGVQDEREIGLVPLRTKYSRSYHFSMGAITTVSYGDIAPQNAWETFVTTFVIIISIVLFGMLSGGFNQVLEMELGQRADYEEKIASVAHFMMFHRFPARIWNHMQSYFMVHWKESQGMNEEELLSGLPLSVKHDITLFVKQEFVKQMKLFATCDEAFVRAVVVAFDQELFVRNDVIISYGERGRRSLYVIESGHVLVRVPKKLGDSSKRAAANAKANSAATAFAAPAASPRATIAPLTDAKRDAGRMTFSQGADLEILKGRFDFFGEKSLIFDVPRSATCIALSSCSMLILTLEKYEEILQEFPEYREKNMREWIFANARENTPASAIRTPGVMAAMRAKSVRVSKKVKTPIADNGHAAPAATDLAVADLRTRSASSSSPSGVRATPVSARTTPPLPPPPLPPLAAGPSMPNW